MFEVHKLPRNVPINVGPPPTSPTNIRKLILGLFASPVSGPTIPNHSVVL
jgi:hypothetical protein